MPQIDYGILRGELFRQTSTNTFDLKFDSYNSECDVCVTPKSNTVDPAGPCWEFLDPGVELPERIMLEVSNPVGPGLTLVQDSVASTYEGNAGTRYRVGYVQGPSPQILGTHVYDSNLVQGLLNSGSVCTKTNNITPNPLITIDSGWWKGVSASFEWLPTADTVNINMFTLEQEAWPDGTTTSDERTVATGSSFFTYSLNKSTGLLTCAFEFKYNASDPGFVDSAGAYGNAYITNAFLRTSDGARIDVDALVDTEAPSGFDASTMDVPDYKVEGTLQINADGTWYQTGGSTVTGGTGGAIKIWLA